METKLVEYLTEHIVRATETYEAFEQQYAETQDGEAEELAHIEGFIKAMGIVRDYVKTMEETK